MEKTSKKEARVIRASLELQQKVGTGSIDSVRIDQAQQVINTTKVDFEPLARPQLEQLQKAVARARQGVSNEKAVIEGIMQPIMNLKANAGTFNYPAISDMTGTVLNFLESVRKIDNEILDIIDNLHKAVTVAVVQKLSGVNNKLGEKLATEFKGVCKRYVDKRLG